MTVGYFGFPARQPGWISPVPLSGLPSPLSIRANSVHYHTRSHLHTIRDTYPVQLFPICCIFSPMSTPSLLLEYARPSASQCAANVPSNFKSPRHPNAVMVCCNETLSVIFTIIFLLEVDVSFNVVVFLSIERPSKDTDSDNGDRNLITLSYHSFFITRVALAKIAPIFYSRHSFL